MRNILTALASVVILILIAALAAPPFIDWAGQRALIDRMVTASLGVSARSEGRIAVRLLPSPRLQLDRLQLGSDDPSAPALDATDLRAELSLTPLIKGEFRFTETRIGRAELRLPVSGDETILLPSNLGAASARDLVIEDLRIDQALVTTLVPATGRTDQILAQTVAIKAPSLAGPWQIEGTSHGMPFRVATSALARDGGMTLKASGGSEGGARFEADAQLSLKPAEPAGPSASGLRAYVPEAEGNARIVAAASKEAPAALAYTLSGKFKSRGPLARFETLNAEIDPAGQSVRMTGSGQFDLRQWRAALALESRRINLDAFLYAESGRALLARLGTGSELALPVLVDLDLSVESLALGFEDWSDVALRGTFDRAGGLVLRRLAGSLAGSTRLDVSGEVEFAPAPRFNGHVEVTAGQSEGLGRVLRKLGIEGFGLNLLDGRPLNLWSDVSAGAQETRLDALRLTLGETTLKGRARYAKAGLGSRGRFEADLQAQGLDIAELPSLSGFLGGLERTDLSLKLTARGVRYGPAGLAKDAIKGAITADIQSDGTALVVERLDIDDLAGANARLSGRLAADGAGRIAGKVAAPTAAPLVALMERVWLAEARLVPRFLREGALDLDISVEREPQQSETLRASAKGQAADTAVDAKLLTRGGHVAGLDATLAGSSAGRWFGREDIPGLHGPARLTLSAKRGDHGDALDLDARGTFPGLTLSTPQKLRFPADLTMPEAGRVAIEASDLAPFLTLAGSASLPQPLPAALTLDLSRRDQGLHADIAGHVGGDAASGSIDRGEDGSLSGQLRLARLSLPALAAAVVMPVERDRFAPAPDHPRADLALAVDRLELGRGLVATKAAFVLGLDDASFALRDLKADLAGGRLTGGATLARQGTSVSISGQGTLSEAALAALSTGAGLGGRLSTSLRFTAVGESPQALATGLGGSGELTLSGLTLPAADPGALERALARVLNEDDPLREGRLSVLLAEEFAAAPLTAGRPVTVPATLLGSMLRSAPFTLELGSTRWTGSFAFDLREARLDARGALTAGSAPKGWSGAKPSVQLGFVGPLAELRREVDPGPLTNGLAALVLQRELEKIEVAEADQAERQRRRARIEMEKARAAAIKAAAEKAAQEKAAAEEASKQARQRAQQAAAEEQARRERADEDAKRARETEPPPSPSNEPLDIRPPGANPN